MSQPVMVDFNGIAFPSDPDGVNALFAALDHIVNDPYSPDKIAPLYGEMVLVVTARSPSSSNRVAGVVYQTREIDPPTGAAYLAANRLTSEPYTLVTIKHMVVILR